jgi:hypothetical protein
MLTLPIFHLNITLLNISDDDQPGKGKVVEDIEIIPAWKFLLN